MRRKIIVKKQTSGDKIASCPICDKTMKVWTVTDEEILRRSAKGEKGLQYLIPVFDLFCKGCGANLEDREDVKPYEKDESSLPEVIISYLGKFEDENKNNPLFNSKDDLTDSNEKPKKFWGTNPIYATRGITPKDSMYGLSPWITVSKNYIYIGDNPENKFPIELAHHLEVGKQWWVFCGDWLKNSKGSDIGCLDRGMGEMADFSTKFIIGLRQAINAYRRAQDQKSYKNRLIEKKQEFESQKKLLIDAIDVDDKNNIIVVPNEVYSLLKANQNKITEIDKSYVQKFVKISNYLNTKIDNIKALYQKIQEEQINEKDTVMSLKVKKSRIISINQAMRDQIKMYNILIFHSIAMITALESDDLITFYEIYECFDKLNIFNSNWENEVADKLVNIGDKLDDLIKTIKDMERTIVSSISELTYVTSQGFNNLSSSMNKQLGAINSSLKVNNLLTAIRVYQEL